MGELLGGGQRAVVRDAVPAAPDVVCCGLDIHSHGHYLAALHGGGILWGAASLHVPFQAAPVLCLSGSYVLKSQFELDWNVCSAVQLAW